MEGIDPACVAGFARTRRAEPWLESLLALQPANDFGVVSSVGALVRFARPSTSGSVIKFGASMNVEFGEFTRLNSTFIAGAMAPALVAVTRGMGALCDVNTLSTPDPELRALVACTLRDDLESVATVAGRAGCADRLEAALAEFDRVGAIMLPRLVEVGGRAALRNDRLRTVFWQQPDAWWGQVCRGLRR